MWLGSLGTDSRSGLDKIQDNAFNDCLGTVQPSFIMQCNATMGPIGRQGPRASAMYAASNDWIWFPVSEHSLTTATCLSNPVLRLTKAPPGQVDGISEVDHTSHPRRDPLWEDRVALCKVFHHDRRLTAGSAWQWVSDLLSFSHAPGLPAYSSRTPTESHKTFVLTKTSPLFDVEDFRRPTLR